MNTLEFLREELVWLKQQIVAAEDRYKKVLALYEQLAKAQQGS